METNNTATATKLADALDLEFNSAPLDEGWNWKATVAGDRIAGTVTSMEQVDSRLSDEKKLVIKVNATLCRGEGQEQSPGIYSIWESASIRIAAKEKHLTVGDYLALRYEGTGVAVKGKNGRKNFRVIVKHPEGFETSRPKTADDFSNDVPF